MAKATLQAAVSSTLMGILLCISHARAQSATAMPHLDVDRTTGAWYEIAHLPSNSEKDCISNNVVLFAHADKPKKFQIVNSCLRKDDTTNSRNADATLAKNGEAKLKIIYNWPFSQKHWVLAADPQYDWILIGSPNHKLLWILSRTVTMTPEVRSNIESQAAAQGYKTAKLITVKQNRSQSAN